MSEQQQRRNGKGYRAERGIVYATPGGKKLRMTLYVPDDGHKSPRPGLVVLHGGAWIVGTRYQQAWYCREFARHGIVVMTIEYRMMPRYPFPHCLHDSKAAVRWLRANAQEWGVDPDRIAAFGASAGGHLAGLLATTRPEDGLEGTENLGWPSTVRGSVILYGSVDLTNYRDVKGNSLGRRMGEAFLRKFVGPDDRWEGRDAYEAASAATYASSESAPVLMVHGERDTVVPIEQPRRLAEALRSHNVYERLVEVPGRNHAFDFIYWGERRRVFKQMLAFLEERIGPFGEGAS